MLSIIISWKNRKELSQTVQHFVDTAEQLRGEVIIVNFDGDKQFIDDLIKQVAFDQIKVVNVGNQPLFNKAAANNIGASFSKFDRFFFCDCDIILEPETLKGLFEAVGSAPGNFGTLEGVKETVVNSIQNNHILSFGYELFIKTKNGRTLKIKDAEEDANDGTRNAPGLLMTSKRDFQFINGYNSNLVGWGWEDQDIISRLTLGAGLNRKFFGRALHISHDDTERTKHYPISNRWESRDKMFRQALANYDANDFSGTYDKDIINYQVD